MKYPLGEYEREKITSKTGKKLDDINLEEIKIKPTVKPWTPVENTLNKKD